MKNIEFTYVKAVAEEKSFSKASKKLGISQPALSTYISKLEKQWGVLLFDRSISPIEITEFGKYYLNYADEVIAATNKFENIKSDLMDLKTGRIVLGSTSCFSTSFLPWSIAQFRKEYSGIYLDIIEGKATVIQEKCLAGQVDMFLSDACLDEDVFEKEILFKERILMAVQKNDEINQVIGKYAIPTEVIVNGTFDEKKYQPIDLTLVKDKEFILLNEDQRVRQLVDELFKNSNVKPKVIMQVAQSTTGFSMAMENIGIAFVGESTIRYGNVKEHLNYYMVGKNDEMVRALGVAYKRNKYISNAGKKLIEQFKKSYR